VEQVEQDPVTGGLVGKVEHAQTDLRRFGRGGAESRKGGNVKSQRHFLRRRELTARTFANCWENSFAGTELKPWRAPIAVHKS
jgi:hypothetical protein